MKVDEFYSMTPRNFINAQNGSKKLYDQNQQAEWERARWMACVIINPHLKRAVDPKKITTFPWELYKNKNNTEHNYDQIMQESKYDDAVKTKQKQNA